MVSIIENIGNTPEFKSIMENEPNGEKQLLILKVVHAEVINALEQVYKETIETTRNQQNLVEKHFMNLKKEKNEWRKAYENELKKNKNISINLEKTEEILVKDIFDK